ncbi:MAG: tetratricopeptide repeat protein [Oscillospiraceae bacterium]|nr:tetratricopeptide repeat protein [Oscillospiraceae bacterium]
MRCCFDPSEYTGLPDTEPCERPLDVPAVIRGLDALYARGREDEAQSYLERHLREACEAGDWRAELSFTSELLGQYRRSMDREKGLAAVERALELVRSHRLGRTVSGATVLLNAATTLGCFGEHEEALPIFRHVSRVYGEHLDPRDYRFAGLFNNMAQSHAALGEFEQAEAMFLSAVKIMETLAGGENEIAVTLCSLAELYDAADPEDPRIADCLERAWACLDEPSLKRDGYYAFMASKCVPVFDRLGFFLYAKDLEERIRTIHEGT